FDPDQAEPTQVRQYVHVLVNDDVPDLGDGWNFSNEQLVWKRQPPIPASAVSRTTRFVWAVSGDGTQLTSYDPATGEAAGSAVVIQPDVTAVGGAVQQDSIPDTAPTTSVGTGKTPTPPTTTPGG